MTPKLVSFSKSIMIACLVIVSMSTSGCGPAQLLDPTPTLTPMPTLPPSGVVGHYINHQSTMVIIALFPYDSIIGLPVYEMEGYTIMTMGDFYFPDVVPGPYSLALLTFDPGTMQVSSPFFLVGDEGEVNVYYVEADRPVVLGNLLPSQFEPAAFSREDTSGHPFYSSDSTRNSLRITPTPTNDLRVCFGENHNISWSPDGERLAYESTCDGNSEIYLAIADGSGLMNLTHASSSEEGPSWSPDGSRIAFTSNMNGEDSYDIYIMNSEGSGLANLTNDKEYDSNPVWSPDGLHIAFKSVRDGQVYAGVYIMDPEGEEISWLTDGMDFLLWGLEWSPDGSQIAFCTDHKLYVASADGSEIKEIPVDADIFYVTWSPDSSRLAYGYYDIFIINADGSNLINLTKGSISGFQPDWSPDGRRIVFSANQGMDIYVINVDGTGLENLTNNSAIDNAPMWSPDGTRIAFTSTRDPIYHIFVMNADGTNVINLSGQWRQP